MEEIVMAAATLPAASVSTGTVTHPLRNQDYRLWLIGGTISLLGDQFYLVALPWLVLQQTGSVVAMGAIMMTGAIPRALLMLMGGAASDRISARKIMMATATARTMCVTVIGVLVWVRILRTWSCTL
jgi:MFS family permease